MPCAPGTLGAGPPGIPGPRRYFAGTRRGPPSGGLLCCGLPFAASPRERDDLHDILDGPVSDFTLSLAWLRVGTSLALPPGFTLFRFSPQLALIHQVRMTNAQGQDYEFGETPAGRTRVVFRHPPRRKRWHARCLEER